MAISNDKALSGGPATALTPTPDREAEARFSERLALARGTQNAEGSTTSKQIAATATLAAQGSTPARAAEGKQVDAQGLLKAFSAKGLKYDGDRLVLSAGDAANVVVAVNGGPVSGKQLDTQIKNGFVRISNKSGKWSLDATKLNEAGRRQIVSHVLGSSSFNQPQKHGLLKRIGIDRAGLAFIDRKVGNVNGWSTSFDIENADSGTQVFTGPQNETQLFDVNTEGLNRPVAVRTIGGFLKSVSPSRRPMALEQIKFVQKLSPWTFDPGESKLDKTLLPYLLSGLTGGKLTRANMNSLVKSGTIKVNTKDLAFSIGKFDGNAKANTVAAILFDPKLSNPDRSVMLEKLGWSRDYQRKVEKNLTGGKGTNGFLEASDFGFRYSGLKATDGETLSSTVRQSGGGGGTPPRPAAPRINVDEMLARQLQREEFVENFGAPLGLPSGGPIGNFGLPELDVLPNLKMIMVRMTDTGSGTGPSYWKGVQTISRDDFIKAMKGGAISTRDGSPHIYKGEHLREQYQVVSMRTLTVDDVRVIGQIRIIQGSGKVVFIVRNPKTNESMGVLEKRDGGWKQIDRLQGGGQLTFYIKARMRARFLELRGQGQSYRRTIRIIANEYDLSAKVTRETVEPAAIQFEMDRMPVGPQN